MTESLQEELRTRLYLIRDALQRGQQDNEFLQIQNTFTNRTFQTFFTVVNNANQLQEKLDQILMDKLKAGKSDELASCVD